MNNLSAVITSIERIDSLYLLEVMNGDTPFSLLLFDLKPVFSVGSKVTILFKESEVALAKGLCGRLSFSNMLEATVTDIRKGVILAQVTLTCAAGEIGSLITTRAADRLELREGERVTVMIKASQISLEAEV